MTEPRKRFFVNGEPAPMSDYHGRYMIPALNLLAECGRAQVPQRKQEISEPNPQAINKQIVGFPPFNYDEAEQFVRGAIIRVKADPPEVWIDLDVVTASHSVRTEGGEDDEPLLWIGARLGESWLGPAWGYDASVMLFLVQEPDREFGVPNQEVGNALHVFRRATTPHTHISNYVDERSYGGVGANPVVQITDNGLCMTGINHQPVQWNPDPFFYYYNQPQDYWWINDGGSSSLGAGWAMHAAFDFNKPSLTERGIDYYEQRVPLWDFCAWLDPTKKVDTVDGHLKNVLQLPSAFERFGITPRVLPGQYVVKIGIHDGWCLGRDWAEGKDNNIEVEIRVGKGRNQVRKRFIVNPMQFTAYNRTCCTYGFEKPPNVGSWCNYEYGDNPHWKNWWQGAFLIDVKARKIEARDYFVPTNGSFAPGQVMSNWECDWQPQFQITFLGTAMPWSTYYQSPPQFPQVMASMAMEAGGYSGYPWGDPANYPIQCPAWCFGGNELDATMQMYLNAAMSSGLEFGKMYLFTKQIVDNVATLKFTETSVDVNDYVGEVIAGSQGPATQQLISLANTAFIEFTDSSYNQSAAVMIPGTGTTYITTDGPAPDDANECVGDSVHDAFIQPQPAIEIAIPPGE